MEQQLYSTAAERQQQQTVTAIEGLTGHKQLLTTSTCMTTVAYKATAAGMSTAREQYKQRGKGTDNK
jgi:hypothetical protein